MKKGRLTKDEKSYITKYASKMSIPRIAAKLERSEKSVESFIAKNLEEMEEKVAEEKEVKESALDYMAVRSDRGVVIMTETASMRADDSYKLNKKYGDKYNNSIRKIRADRD